MTVYLNHAGRQLAQDSPFNGQASECHVARSLSYFTAQNTVMGDESWFHKTEIVSSQLEEGFVFLQDKYSQHFILSPPLSRISQGSTRQDYQGLHSTCIKLELYPPHGNARRNIRVDAQSTSVLPNPSLQEQAISLSCGKRTLSGRRVGLSPDQLPFPSLTSHDLQRAVSMSCRRLPPQLRTVSEPS